MNTITFSPKANTYNNINLKQSINHTAFTGKKVTPQQAKKTCNFVQQLYGKLFVPCGENLKGIKNGQVYTEKFSAEGNIRTSKRYNMWSKRPNAVIKDNGITALREKTVFNKDGSRDIEIQDIYTPDYPIKIGYQGVDSKGIADNGVLSITYGDKKVSLTKKERENLYEGFNEVLDEKFPQSPSELSKLSYEEFNELYKDFYTTPEAIASRILSGHSSVKDQLETVPRALPYGIECILDKLGK